MDPDRVLRYLTGQMSTEEAVAMRAWLEADAARAEQMRVMVDAWQRTFGPPAAGADESWDRIARRTTQHASDRTLIPIEPRLAARGTAPPRESASRAADRGRGVHRRPPGRPARTALGGRASPRGRTRRTFPQAARMRWAAMLLLAAGGAALWTQRARFVPEPTLQSFATAAGERVTLTLAGGSRVLLGPASELRFPARESWPWSRDRSREVQLDGIAYFDIAHDARRPFVVNAGSAVTRVLGTRFVVRAYGGESGVDVAVVEGRVAVRADTAAVEGEITLAAGERGRVEASGTARRLDDRADAMLAWVDGRLVFRDAPVRDVVREIERWYAVEIEVSDDELAERRVTISFDGEPFAESLALLAAALDVGAERDGRRALLIPKTPETR